MLDLHRIHPSSDALEGSESVPGTNAGYSITQQHRRDSFSLTGLHRRKNISILPLSLAFKCAFLQVTFIIDARGIHSHHSYPKNNIANVSSSSPGLRSSFPCTSICSEAKRVCRNALQAYFQENSCFRRLVAYHDVVLNPHRFAV